ncbi:hypothetical protein PQX77_018885 [Marasmius sp. AFHP31]|nr:hypothetical protein PQX77_018885 [Marasmius sp. AFHP31]
MLPPEVILQILDGFMTVQSSGSSRRQSLCNCCLINSGWRAVAQPLLFRDLQVVRLVPGAYQHSPCNRCQPYPAIVNSLKALVESIDRRPELLSYIHNVGIQDTLCWCLDHQPENLQDSGDIYIVSLLSKLAGYGCLKSIELLYLGYRVTTITEPPVKIKEQIQSLLALPSLVSLRMEFSTYRSAYDFFHTTLTYATNLQILDLTGVEFAENFDDDGDTNHANYSHAPARSIHLKTLLLMYTNLGSLTRFFDSPSCPLAFDSLERLGLAHGILEVNSGPVELMRIVGKNIEHLVLNCYLPEDPSVFETPTGLLTLTPSLRSLFLQNSSFICSPLTQDTLFPHAPFKLQNICITFLVTIRKGRIFVDRGWQSSSLDDLFSDAQRFPNLRLVEFLAQLAGDVKHVRTKSPRVRANLTHKVEERFPKLSAAKKLSVIFSDDSFWP